MRLLQSIRVLLRGSLPLVERLLGSIKGARTDRPVAALTFDDGPHPDHTPAILEALDAHGVKATFFFIAHRAAEHAELARRVAAEGHEIGLHGMDHLPVPLLTTRAVVDRIWRGRRILEEVLGQPIRLYRPPYGGQTVRTYLIARLAGMQVVGWTALCEDWEVLEPEEITDRGAERLEPGGILLLHDYVEADVRRPVPLPTFDRDHMVNLLLVKLEERGYAFHTVTDLITSWPERRTLWFWWRARLKRERELDAIT